MSKSNTFENDLLKLTFNGTPIANLADNAGSSPATELFIGLHAADPGEAGSQTTSEISYAGYERVAVARSSGGLTVSNNTVVPVSPVEFADAPSGTNQTATHWHIGTLQTGTGKILYRGAISPNIVITEGVRPRLGTFNISED